MEIALIAFLALDLAKELTDPSFVLNVVDLLVLLVQVKPVSHVRMVSLYPMADALLTSPATQVVIFAHLALNQV